VAVGLASAILNSMLNALARNVAWVQPAAYYVKLHTGDPGAAGAANAAANTTRKQATFSAAAGGAITTSADLVWNNVPNAETYSHISFWDTVGPAGGTFLGSDDLAVARTVAVGDNFSIVAGQHTITLTPVAA
jgi:hypothetical protein